MAAKPDRIEPVFAAQIQKAQEQIRRAQAQIHYIEEENRRLRGSRSA
jgi:hypothetical protein